MRLLRNMGVVSAMTMASRVFGFVREILMAGRLGAGPVADVFFQALTIPNTFRRILAEGAFNAAFVPLYAGDLEAKDQQAADAFASQALSVLFTVTLILVAVFQLLAPWLVYVFFPGQIDDPEALGLAVLLLQIMMPYLLCMAVVALISGGLNSHGRFAAAAGAPLLFNIVLIGIQLFDMAQPARLAVALSIGVTVSGVLQAALLWIAARGAGLRLTLRLPKLTPGVKRLIVLGVPGAIAAGATQINVLVTSSIATLEEGARSWLNYSERLYQLPLGVIGIAMGLALLPNLARRVQSGDEAGGLFAMNRAIELSLAFTLPATAAFLFIPGFLIESMFEWGRFTADDTAATAAALAAYALGLPAFILIKVLAPGFFARQDTQTPMRFALWSVALNFALALVLFFGGLGFVGLALASAAAGWLNAGLLWITMRARGYHRADARLRARTLRLTGASLAMGAVVWSLAGPARGALESILPATDSQAGTIALMLLIVGAGAGVYGGLCILTGALRPAELAEAIRPARGARPAPGDSPEI